MSDDDIPWHWPQEIICHATDFNAKRYNETGLYRWRAPHKRRAKEDPYTDSYRTCSYCGCIHPEDLYKQLVGPNNVTMEQADWKYGWPHKFYVNGIPNLSAGEEVYHYRYAPREKLEEMDNEFEIEEYSPDQFRRVESTSPASGIAFAKWYSLHILDLQGTTFARFSRLITERTGIEFFWATGEDESALAWRVV